MEALSANSFISDIWNDSKTILFAHEGDPASEMESMSIESFHRCMVGTSISSDDVSIPELASRILTKPNTIDTVISYSPFSDVLSEMVAKLTGGTYLVPCATINRTRGLFRPLHGSNPDLAGYNATNPTASLRCAAMMLDFLGYKDEGNKLWEAIRSAYKRGFRTPDVGGGTGTYGFIEQIVKICENPN